MLVNPFTIIHTTNRSLAGPGLTVWPRVAWLGLNGAGWSRPQFSHPGPGSVSTDYLKAARLSPPCVRAAISWPDPRPRQSHDGRGSVNRGTRNRQSTDLSLSPRPSLSLSSRSTAGKLDLRYFFPEIFPNYFSPDCRVLVIGASSVVVLCAVQRVHAQIFWLHSRYACSQKSGIFCQA